MKYFRNALPILAILFIFGCSAPRNIMESGKVTSHGRFKGGVAYSVNFPTQFAKSIFNLVENNVDRYISTDSVFADAIFDQVNEAIYSYSLDPLKVGLDFSIRYGIHPKFDMGYKYSSGTSVFDTRYQFLAPKEQDSLSNFKLYGSIGIQYSQNKFELPSAFKLDKLQSYLGYSYKRKDVVVPLIFSLSFGKDEKYGCFSYGLVYNFVALEYSYLPKNIYTLNKASIQGRTEKSNYSSFGLFTNIKGGYRFAYLLFSLTCYYQKYGTFELLSGKNIDFSGFTFVPSVGLQLQTGNKDFKKKNRVKNKQI